VTSRQIPVKNEVIKTNLALSLLLTSGKLTEIVIYEQLIVDGPHDLQILYFIDFESKKLSEISVPADAGMVSFHSISRLTLSPQSSVVLSGMEFDQKSQQRLAYR